MITTEHPVRPSAELRPRLPRPEAALLAVTIAHLCFLPWALGTMHPWSQLTSLGLAVAGFGLAVWPRRAGGLARLTRFPIFWAGLALALYITIQGLNPGWRFVSNETSWWLERASPLAWLPSGIEAPFGRSNPWRALTVVASLWLLACSVWAGLRHRRSYRLLFTALVANACLVALLGLGQKISGARRIFGAYTPSNDSFMASFIYPNHAGPYFYLMAALATGLAWWHYQQAWRGQEGPLRARLLTIAGGLIGFAVFFSYSRTSILLFGAFTLVVGGVLITRSLTHHRRDHPEFRRLALALVLVLGAGVVSLRPEKLWARFSSLVTDPSEAARGRNLASRAAMDMLRARWFFGWGAGGFRHAFPLYSQHYPAIYLSAVNGRQYWEHAHNDLLEIPVEVGALGLLPVLATLGWGARRLARQRFWRNPVALCAGLGGALVFAHAAVDFVFQCPAVLLTWGVLLVGLIRCTELAPDDESGPRRLGSLR